MLEGKWGKNIKKTQNGQKLGPILLPKVSLTGFWGLLCIEKWSYNFDLGTQSAISGSPKLAKFMHKSIPKSVDENIRNASLLPFFLKTIPSSAIMLWGRHLKLHWPWDPKSARYSAAFPSGLPRDQTNHNPRIGLNSPAMLNFWWVPHSIPAFCVSHPINDMSDTHTWRGNCFWCLDFVAVTLIDFAKCYKSIFYSEWFDLNLTQWKEVIFVVLRRDPAI